LLNIECNAEAYAELMYSFRFNDAILRYLVLNLKDAVKSPSAMMSGAPKED
jgi:small subunit ribosomal protein S6